MVANAENDDRSPKRQKRIAQQSSLSSFFAKKVTPDAATDSDAPQEPSQGDPHSSTTVVNNDEDANKPAAATSTNATHSLNSSITATTDNNSTKSLLDPIIPQPVSHRRQLIWRSHSPAILYHHHPNTPSRPKVAAFDLDGTLFVWRNPSTWPSRLSDYELWNPSVIPTLQRLYDTDGYQLMIVTNQGGIRKAHTGKIATRLQQLLEWFLVHQVQRPVSVICSTDKKAGYHKPSVLLWNVAEQLFRDGRDCRGWHIGDSLLVGDSVGGPDDPQGGTDIGLAANVSAEAGVELRFYTPTAYFGPSTWSQRQQPGVGQRIPARAQAARAALVSGVVDSGSHDDASRVLPSAAILLLLLCGAQGSGKSTFATQLAHACPPGRVQIYSQDTIHNGKPGKREQVEEAVAGALQEAVTKDSATIVIVDRMHLNAAQREHFVTIGQQHQPPCHIHAVVFDPPVSVVRKRVRERQNHIVMGEKGAELAARSAQSLQYPTYDEEGFALISGVKGAERAELLLRQYQNLLQNSGEETKGSSNNDTSPNQHEHPRAFPLQQYHTSDDPTLSVSSPLLELPSILLGTMKMGRRTAADTVSRALQSGVVGVDCAPTYNNEDVVGQSLSPDTFCITKVPKRAGTADEVAAELATSLSKLNRHSVDLLLLHWAPPPDSLEEIWRAMEGAVRKGQARALGICNCNLTTLQALITLAVFPPVVVQVERHPLLPQWELLDFCAQRDIQLQAHTPLGQGKDVLLKAVEPIAAQFNAATDTTATTAAQMILAWNLQQGVAVVPKCSTEDHLRQLQSLPVLRPNDVVALNQCCSAASSSTTSTTRFVDPPFMRGGW